MWDGDLQALLLLLFFQECVPSPPCGMVTGKWVEILSLFHRVPSPPCGMVTFGSFFLPGSLLVFVPSPPCGMVTQLINSISTHLIQFVLSPPCGMVTCLRWFCKLGFLQQGSKPTVWDGDTTQLPPPPTSKGSEPTVWDGDCDLHIVVCHHFTSFRAHRVGWRPDYFKVRIYACGWSSVF